MSLIIKELYLIKEQYKKFIFILLVISGIIIFFIYKEYPHLMIQFFSIFITGMVFVLQIMQNSIQTEKTNKTFEKMLSCYKLQEVILYKCIVSFFVGSLMGLFFGLFASFIFVQFLDMPLMKVGMTICVLSLMLLFNLLVCSILPIMFLLINQVIVINILCMILTGIIMSITYGLTDTTNIYLYTMGYGSIMLIISFICYKLVQLIPNDKVY